ncbi:MAG: FAD-binding oxidoreductase [Flavobacteriaceae bacterium]|nr:FAD-binding oxidoreductase [Flavobacteriaceae bacterium]
MIEIKKHTIIVGYGLAGFCYAYQLHRKGLSFCIIDQPLHSATRQAAGVCNPTQLKRYSLAWEAPRFLAYAARFYAFFEKEYSCSVFQKTPIHRYFHQVSEQNLWGEASYSHLLAAFLEADIIPQGDPNIRLQNGYGIVKQAARLNTVETLETFSSLLDSSAFRKERFDYEALQLQNSGIQYKNIEAQQIVFCEGFGIHSNPFFKQLPVIGAKGESLLIRAPELATSATIKSGIFIVPMEADIFWIGATFDHHDKTNQPTEQGKLWLLNKLNRLLDTPFELLAHQAAVRPTVIDRRPILGKHATHPSMAVFNGLGTRGAMMAPLLSEWLFQHLNEGKALPVEVALDRF